MTPCDVRPWDSSFFGLSIANVVSHRVTADDLRVAIAWAGDAGIDCLYLLVDADHDDSVRAAEANGFAFVDVRMTMDRPIAGIGSFAAGRDALHAAGVTVPEVRRQTDQPGESSARRARAGDLTRLTSIARVSHRNTRFYRDTHFDPRRSDEMYAVWIERAVRGELADAVWIVEESGSARGYLTASAAPDHATIGLVAVDEAFRGRGYGEQLLRTAIDWARGKGLGRISVVTQGLSAASVRFYERAGFTASRIELWYHNWIRA